LLQARIQILPFVFTLSLFHFLLCKVARQAFGLFVSINTYE
jgi:hypothetical protein